MNTKEAIERIKARFDKWALDNEDMKAIQTLIPELTQSEDEKIRKFFTELATDACGGPGQEYYEELGLNYDKVITWLEERKELPFMKDVRLGYPGLYFYDGERMHFQGNPTMEEKQKEQKSIPSREMILGIWELGNFWKENPEARDGLTQLQYIQKYWNEKCDYQKEQKSAEKPDLVAELKHHLATTPKEQLQKEWDDLKEWNNVGPTAKEYLYGKHTEWSKEDKDVVDEAAELALGWGCPNLSAKLKSILSRVKHAERSEDDKSSIELIRKLLINARSVQSNSSLWKQYDDALLWLEKQKEPKSTIPSRNEILGIWELGNIWKDYPDEREGLTQLQFIQKHWYDKNDYNPE